MKALILHDSDFSNNHQVSDVMAGLMLQSISFSLRLVCVDDLCDVDFNDVDLMVIACHAHQTSTHPGIADVLPLDLCAHADHIPTVNVQCAVSYAAELDAAAFV